MRAYFKFVLRNRWLVLALCIAVSAASLAALADAVIASSVGKMFFGDLAEYKAYQQRARQFVNDEVFIIGYEDDAPLSGPSLQRLRRVVRAIERMPEVARVESLLAAQRIWSRQETLVVEAYAESALQKPGESGALLDAMRSDDLLAGLLLAKDGGGAAVLVELSVDPNRPAERAPRLVKDVVHSFTAAGFNAARLHRAGFPALMGEIMDQTRINLTRLTPITVVVLLVVVFALFRRIGPAALALAVSGMAVLWTLGFARTLERDFNIMFSVVPAVILIVAFSDVIHLWSAFQIERARGRNKHEAILASASDVGAACLMTSATTFVGFICLSAVPTPVFQQVGLVLGFGVAVALLLAMTLVPIALSLTRVGAGPPSRTTHTWLDPILRAVARLTTRRPRLVIGAFAVAFALVLAGLSRATIETDLSERIDPATAFRMDQRFFAQHFAGTNTLEIFIDTDKEGRLLDPAVFSRIALLQDSLEALPSVDKALSLVNLMETLHRVLGGEGRLPTKEGALAQYLLLFEMSGGKEIERLVDFPRRSMRIALRLNDHGVRTTHEVGQAAKQQGARLLAKHATVEPSGLAFLMGWWLDTIVAGQRNGLLFSFVIIAAMMVFGLGSVRVGLGSMIANVFPLLSLGGYLGVAYDRIDSDTLVIAMIALGIGVDDTIHFLMRYRLESSRTSDSSLAIERTFAFSGRAIILTTVVLVLGFAPFGFSDYFTAQILGTLLPGVLVVALLADLLLLPALVQIGWLRFRNRRIDTGRPSP